MFVHFTTADIFKSTIPTGITMLKCMQKQYYIEFFRLLNYICSSLKRKGQRLTAPRCSTEKTAGHHKSLTQNLCHREWNTQKVQHTGIQGFRDQSQMHNCLFQRIRHLCPTASCLSWAVAILLNKPSLKNNLIGVRQMWIQLWALIINHKTLFIFLQLPPHPLTDHSQLYWASCLPSTFRTLRSPTTVTPRALWSCANLPFAKLPSIPPEAHHLLPLGHGVMQRYKPLTGVLLLGWIHEDSLEAQWSSSPLVKSQVRDACGPPVSYNQHHHLATVVLNTHQKTHIMTNLK